jgi:NAD(P)-dependent dehydrogenase (short-subunit alcohol dehydrogenase family)
MSDFISLKEKNILVVGASSGIGRAIAIGASEMGANVTCLSRRGNFLPEFEEIDNKIKHASLDVKDISSIEQFINLAPLPFDGFVYASGRTGKTPIHTLEKQQLDDVMDTNLNGFLFFSKELTRQRKINNGGSIVMISSISGHTGTSGLTPYTVSKAGLSSVAKVLAREFARKKIRYNAISPAMVRTAIFEPHEQDWLNQVEKDSYPLGLGEPEDIAAATIFLLSDKSNYITGIDLIMSGGCEWIY